MLNETVPVSLLVRTNVYAFCDDEKKRREGALKNKDYFYGRQEQYLSLLNEDVDKVTVNLSNPIISKRASLLYSTPLVREFDGPKSSVSKLEEIYYDIKIDDILHQVDLSAELTGTSLVFVGLDDDSKKVTLVPYDASDFSVVTLPDYNTIEALQLININDVISKKGPQSVMKVNVKRVIESEVWTNSYIFKLIDGIEKRQETNELGYIPFVPFKAQEVINQFLGHSPATSIRQLNSYYNQMSTNLGYMIKMQSATPVILNGFSNGESVSVHPGTAISLPIGAMASALQLNPKIEETLSVLKYLEDKMYETSSVPKIAIIGDATGSHSGIELLIKWAPMSSIFNDKTNRYQTYELNLANMILKRIGLEPIKNVKVNYNKNYLPIDPQREALLEDIKLGIRTPIDEVLKINQNLDEASAEALVLANIEFNKQISNGGLDARTKE
jgi:hypothetical protein